MKRENLYFVGAALLASTAITTSASAGAFKVQGAVAATGDTVLGTTNTAVPLSAQVFAATPSTAQQLGRATIYVRFGAGLQSNNSQVVLSVTGAQFVASSIPGEVQAFNLAGATASTIALGTFICTVQPSTSKLIIGSCNVTTSIAAGSIAGILISGVLFDNATGLATAGGNVALSAELSVNSVALETIASQNVITSKNSITTTVTANSAIGKINVAATPAFASVVTSNLSAQLATIAITQAGAVAGNLVTAVTGAAAHAGAEIKITSTTVTGGGFAGVRLIPTTGNEITSGLTQAAGGSVTFTLSAASLQDSYSVNVQFNGTTAIPEAAAGTAAVTFASAASTANTGNQIAPPAASGSIAGLARSGLSVDINAIQPSVGQGARTYTSLLRIANTGTTAGTVSVVLRNEATGAVLGTYTSGSIPAGGSIQVTSANLESGATVTPAASILYRATVSGSINGYVQHVNWNQDAGFFSDLSAARSVIPAN